jgi:2-haloacid dehalogenase
MKDTTIVAFDLYGTLLSTESIVKQLEKHFSYAKAQSISALWRRYQLEYTWRLNSMGGPIALDPDAILTPCRSI